MEIWVHPGCTTCRAATAALEQAGIAYVAHRFHDEPHAATLGRLPQSSHV